MKISPRKFRGSQFTNRDFDRWFNGGRKTRLKPDKLCALRDRYVTLAQVMRRNKLFGRDRGRVR